MTAAPRTPRPVLVGVAQLANKDPDRILHPMDLIESATRSALADAGPAAGLLATVDAVYTTPVSVFSSTRPADELAARLDIQPTVLVESSYTGSAPQKMLAEAYDGIVAGRIRSAIVAGGIADASFRRAREKGIEPAAPPTAVWSQGSSPAEDYSRQPRFSYGGDGPRAESAAGLNNPVGHFAMIESVMAAAAGHDPETRRRWLGELMAPFTEVAARRPDVSWFPAPRRPEELSGLGPANRMVSQPYPKLMTSFPTVDLAAAVIVTSEEEADRLGVPADRRVHPWAAASGNERRFPSERPDIGRTPVLSDVVRFVLAAAGLSGGEVDLVDVYSCFPAAVQLAAEALGVEPRSRVLTLTGGLPYFGGPGASYVTHAVVALVEGLRAAPDTTGMVVGLGGMANTYSAGLYSAAPPEFAWTNGLDRSDPSPGEPIVVDLSTSGTAQVLAMTVLHDRDGGPSEAPVFAAFPDGRRTAARVRDRRQAAELDGVSLVGRTVRIEVGDGPPTYEVA